MEWLQKYKEIVSIVVIGVTGFLWLNSKFNSLEKDIAVIKAVMVLKNILPPELCKEKEK
jgi:hypothetical protein